MNWLPAWLRPVARGRVLAVRFGLNPNSSSLGVDVTLLLVGSVAVTVLTPVVGVLLRLLARPSPPAAGRTDGDAGAEG